MEAFLSSGVGIAVLSGIAIIGMLVKLFSSIKISKLLKQTKNLGDTKDRQLKQWKFKFENTYRINRGMNNALVYIKKNFSQYYVCGIPVQSLDRVNVTLAGAVALIAIAFGAFALWTRLNNTVTVGYCFVGAVLAGVMLLWERVCGTSFKKEYIVNNIQDFYENTLMSKLELGTELRNAETNVKSVEAVQSENKRSRKYTPIHETNHVEGISKESRYALESTIGVTNRRPSEKMRKDVEYLKQSLDRIAAGREPEYVHPTRKLTENEEKLIEEFIKEYL